MVHGTRTGEEEWDLYGVRAGGDYVWGVHSDGDSFLVGWCEGVVGLEMVVYCKFARICLLPLFFGGLSDFVLLDAAHPGLSRLG